MSEMVERVARAIHAERCTQAAPCPSWEEATPLLHETARALARAAIEAMRVPTVDMVVTGTEDWLCIRAMEDRAEVIWDAMINVALDLAPPPNTTRPTNG